MARTFCSLPFSIFSLFVLLLTRCSFSVANPSSGTTSLHLASRSSDDALRRTSAPSADVASHYLDIAYQGNPVQCSTKDKTCALLSHEFRFEKKGKVLTPDEENGYKYVLDVDANYPSGKFKRLMCVLFPLPLSSVNLQY